MAALLAVALVIPACGGGSSGGAAAAAVLLQILTNGGTGTTGYGGDGDYCEFDLYGAGNLKVMQTGSVNAAVNSPSQKPYLGTAPLVAVTGTQAIATAESSAPLAGATGLHVPAGVTLTVTPNDDEFGATANKTRVWVAYPDGVYIEGTLVIDVMTASPNTSNLYLDCDSLVIAPGGSIVVAGAANGAGTGRTSGYFQITTNNVFANWGTVDGRGGSGSTDGGDSNGGYVYADSSFFNEGTITTAGGAGGTGFGGDGGDLDLYGYYGAHNDGTVSSAGADGPTDGGFAGFINFYSDDLGSLTNAGTFDASGGDATDNGDGGDGGGMYFECNSGGVRIAGTLNSSGGNGGPNGGNGGDGYYIDIYQYDDSNYQQNNYVGLDFVLGAQIDISGGNGDDGGDGDSLYCSKENGYGYANPSNMWIVGYSSMNGSGGDGDLGGGDGGGYSYPIYAYSEYSYDLGEYFIGSQFYNEVPFINRGGNSANGYGGDGGQIEFDIESNNSDCYALNGQTPMNMTNTALLDVSGGNGFDYGGDGGDIYWYNDQYYLNTVGGACNNSGSWDLHGGNGSDTVGGYGGDGGYAYWYSEDNDYGGNGRGDARNSGSINLRGGNGAGDYGGDAGDMYFYADFYGYWNQDTQIWGLINTGSVDQTGGNGATDGGDGGYYEIEGGYYMVTTAVNCGGGNGATGDGGDGGSFYIDYYNYPNWTPETQYVIVNGNVNTSGGDGAVDGGDAGYCNGYHISSFTFNGSIDCSGGNGGTGTGGDGDDFYFYSDQFLVVNGSITVSGGNATTGDGGGADYFYTWTKWTHVTGSCTARGGSSTSGGFGGDGYYIEFWSTELPTQVDGTMDVRGGTGGAGNGTDSYIMIDGMELDAPVTP